MTDEKIEILRPMGPTIGKTVLSEELVTFLNESMTDELADYSNSLVGKVKQELEFSNDITQTVLNELSNRVAAYHLNHQAAPPNAKVIVEAISGWYVRQFQNDYNPLHVHSKGTMSCVGYLKLPDGIEKEFEDDGHDHHPSNGMIEFAYGNAGVSYSTPTYRVKPKVGDFYVFPASLWHTVYPFRTPGERRSFSMNLNI